MGGACNAEILGESAEHMGEACETHVMDMVRAGDEAHQQAIKTWQAQDPEKTASWYKAFQEGFELLEDA